MRFHLNVPEYSIKEDCTFTSDVTKEDKAFPVLTIGRDSYIEEALVDTQLDECLLYNLQIGRYSSVAHDVTFIVDMNHDYKRVCQGRISGYTYERPEYIKRKGQIIIMNDCWIGEKAVIMSGVTIGNGAVVAANAMVTKDVPAYAIVAGNPAKVIGYRFEERQRELLSLIRWWNWDQEKVLSCAEELYGDIDAFLEKHIDEARRDNSAVEAADINIIKKGNSGQDQVLLYVPDFEQEYPTYPAVIDAFAKTYADTNTELLLYVKAEKNLQEHLDTLDALFLKYANANCYVNVYVGDVTDVRSLFGQVDAYVTNRCVDNIRYMDAADLYKVPVISGVDLPIFD